MNTRTIVKKSLTRPIGAAGIAVGLALLGGIAIAAPASAVTNPADNPVRIVVRGDDGQTYVDGQDTLPGYDDEACTYIPGAWFDFKNNRVHYADGQSIPWTEWDRASGYQEWLKSNSSSSGSGTKGGSSSGSGTKTPSKNTGTKTSTGSGSTSTSTKKTSSSGSGSQTSNGSTSTSQAGGSSGTTSGSSTKKAEKKAEASKSTESQTESTTVGATEELTTEQTSAQAGAAEAAGPQDGATAPGPLVGLGILGGLAVVGGLAWAASVFFRRRAAANTAIGGELD